MKTIDPTTIYLPIARKLVATNQAGELPRRYMDLCARYDLILAAIKDIRRQCRKSSALGVIPFKSPLSVAGEDSIVIVRAEKLRLDGFPVALELDSKGRHRGEAICNVQAKLAKFFRRAWTAEEVLEEYRKFLAWSPKVIKHHPEPRIAKLPSLLKHISQEQRTLEGRLREYATVRDNRTFAVTIEADKLFEVICEITQKASGEQFETIQSVVLGFRGPGHQLVLNGRHEIPTACGMRSGVAVVAMHDLIKLSHPHPGLLIMMEFDLKGWMAWRAPTMAVLHAMANAEVIDGERFGYYNRSIEP